MTDTEAAFLHRLEHAPLSTALHALRRAPHLSPAALNVIAHRADLLRSVTLPFETSLPLADLWDEAIRHDRRQEQELILLLRFTPELEVHFTPRQLARYSSDIERLIELAGDPDPKVIEALFEHEALFPRDPHHGFSAPPWAEPVTPAWSTPAFTVRPTPEQWRRLADRLLDNPALDSLNPSPLLRWLFLLPEPYDPRVLLERPHLRLATAGHWCTPPALRGVLFDEAMSTRDLKTLERLLFSRRLQADQQAAVLATLPIEMRALVLQSGAATLPLLEELADDPDLTRDLIDPDGSGTVNYHVNQVRSSERLEATLLIRFGLEICWAVS
ncbi:hypothetical protein [Deinococcus sp. JMULE3]|uniref:hypothetical protein n=1 Tax=Deinococcus sp. JMULE3 TaxID=2518341 RepID=UPI001576DAEE|nr:hypothetical protein [Deinococcus sp. JMULE3]NTY02563.1 hypothetical protein [Deinococcus sp. JMULE3]